MTRPKGMEARRSMVPVDLWEATWSANEGYYK